MHTIGIDAGASTIKVISVSSGRAHRTTEIKTPKNLKDFKLALAGVLADFDAGAARGIGMGIAGVIDQKNGQVLRSPNMLFFKNFELGKFLRRFNRRVAIDNDVNCITLAEQEFGAARGKKNAMVMALGTGIGGGVIINGQLYRGNNGAGEVGHIILDHEKYFETLAGGKTLRKYDKAELDRVGKYVGLACVSIMYLLDPEIIILGGGVTERSFKKYLPAAMKMIKLHAKSPTAKLTKIVPSNLGHYAGALGATLLVK